MSRLARPQATGYFRLQETASEWKAQLCILWSASPSNQTLRTKSGTTSKSIFMAEKANSEQDLHRLHLAHCVEGGSIVKKECVLHHRPVKSSPPGVFAEARGKYLPHFLIHGQHGSGSYVDRDLYRESRKMQ
ncbi:hypothetical protein F4818DRAFT_111211 [Hypoxylon cercidicola]|nr:hypothetical protein F4818DRAFT_111211 [Hypoxylon cercidicola]